ncbi:membrane-binding protein [Fulvivirga sp.]|uniref:toxin-antitoxin system YwqK family antitoxin n=1 Tax=Fulvivirga sp. TaxID=1931237 RepID=UPI0032F04765
MKSGLYYILFTLISYTSQAQVLRYVYHDEDKSKLKEMFYVRDSVSNILEGKYLSYYINGNIESEGQFKNNETYGEWNFYYETGKLKMKGVVKRNSSDGYWEYYYEQGSKSMEGEISNQKRRGEWKIYYESGKLKEKGVFVNNKREGHWNEYYEDGQLKGEADYTYDKGRYIEYYPTGEKKAEGPKSGSRHVGLWKYYYQNGNKQAEGLYQNGKRVEDWRFYHDNGEVSAQGSYKAGDADGEWTYYYDNGQVSSKGDFLGGKKAGYWGNFYEDGSTKGEITFDQGTGEYKEYYKSGKLKLSGTIQNEKNHGVWQYFYENGQLEGECNFIEGRGEYYGYYPDGTLQTKGVLEDGQKVGRWELYKNDGTLSGYYKPIYDEPIERVEPQKPERKARKYGVAAYKFKGRRFSYFQPKINEFQGVILSTNPFATFIGRLPFAMEFYLQERLGHEFEFEGIRTPFYIEDHKVPLNDVYTRGYSITIRQKFYNPTGNSYSLWYFGHEIRFTNQSHFSNTTSILFPENVIRASASEQKVEYLVLLGYRLLQDTRSKGYTIDLFVGAGSGLRKFDKGGNFESAFDDLDQSDITFAYTFGVNIGYAFSFGSRK